ncbi:MAG: biotin/lipoyl-binding protein, partial [Burkholderiales bacterium]|nr:biotin/lipoyl-binding protein [Opitutaceae bacterium]
MNRRSLLASGVALAALAVAMPLALHLRAESASDPAAPSAPAAPPAPVVTVALVEQRTLVEAEELTGRVEAVESVDLRAEVGGRLASVHFASGQTVAAGDLLFTIDPRTYQAAHDAARAAVARAEARAA